MVIPLRDVNPTRRRPVLTWALIALNVVVWVVQVSASDGLQPGLDRWGVVPFYLTQPFLQSWWTPLTSMFMHAGWVHLGVNMWFLHIFGDNVEDELGHGRYAAFYLLCGLAATALHVAMGPTSKVPVVGASGAIAGVLGAYLMLHPRAPVVTIVTFFEVHVPAWIFLFVWLAFQVVAAVGWLGEAIGGGVAFFAHVGGFVAGFLMVRAMRPRLHEPEAAALAMPEHDDAPAG